MHTLEGDLHEESPRTLKNKDRYLVICRRKNNEVVGRLTEKYDNPPDGLVGVEGGS